MRLAALIPAYNEAATIRALVEAVAPLVERVVVVDDGSSDSTAEQLNGLLDDRIKLIRLNPNRGKAGALWAGIAYLMSQDVTHILTLDGDGQHDPNEIRALKWQLKQTPERIIIGARRLDNEHAPRARRMANHIADFWISWAAGRRIHDSQSGFRIYPAGLFQHWRPDLRPGQGFVFESSVLIDAAQRGYYSHAVPISTRYPEQARESHFRPVADITRIVLMVACRLFGQRMNLRGLWRVWLHPDPRFDDR